MNDLERKQANNKILIIGVDGMDKKTAVRSNADRRSFSKYFIQPDGYPGR